METRAHRRLKQLALAYVREHGCHAAAVEVRCPIARYRVDVAGYCDRLPTGEGDRRPLFEPRSRHERAVRTVVIECKQSRSDFLRDRRDREKLLELRQDLERYRTNLEENRIKREEPELRQRGSSLFPELDEWNFNASRLPAYREVLRRLRRLDAMLHGQTKFFMSAWYALADRLFIAAPEGLVRRRELPPGWGLLECAPSALRGTRRRGGDELVADLFGESVLRTTVEAPPLRSREKHRARLLRNIAIAASTTASRALGVLA